jgi:excisionase family DNA binding protein
MVRLALQRRRASRAAPGRTSEMIERVMLSIPETAKALGLSRTSVFQLIKTGKLKVVRLGRRTLVPKVELDRLTSEAA